MYTVLMVMLGVHAYLTGAHGKSADPRNTDSTMRRQKQKVNAKNSLSHCTGGWARFLDKNLKSCV